MTEHSMTHSPEVSVVPTREERLRMFLEILAAAGGTSDCGDWPGSWINAFCEDHEKRSPDTFNRAADLGYTHATYDSDTDHGVVTLTKEGRAHLARLAHQTPPATEPSAAVGEHPRARALWEQACIGREGYCSSDLQDAARSAISAAFREAEAAARSATLPADYQWSDGNREKFEFGRDTAADRIAALHTPPPVAHEGELYGKWHKMLLALVNAIHRDQGEKTQTIGLNLSYEQALAKVSRTPPPVATATVVNADQSRTDYCPGYCARGEPHNGPHDPVVLYRQSGGQVAEAMSAPTQMTEKQALELYRHHCQPGDRGTLERYGEKAAVAAILSLAATPTPPAGDK